MRRPAVLERAGALTPRDRIWSAVRGFGEGDAFSVAEIMLLSEQLADTVLPYVTGLVKAGYLAEDTRAARRPAARPRRECRRFRLVRDTGVRAPRVAGDGREVTQGIGREHMWNVLRRERGDFSWRDLAHRASTPEHPIAEREARDYVRALRLAGYVQRTEPARRGMGRSPERLCFVPSRDTGPRAPLITARKQVVDGNTGRIVYDPNGGKA